VTHSGKRDEIEPCWFNG